MRGHQELADAMARRVAEAADARWLVIGVVTAFAANKITATIDGASITDIRRVASWTTPAATDVGLFGVVRGSSSVQYIGIGKITP
jgi:hypothetical protein